jgi:hypothetical protein
MIKILQLPEVSQANFLYERNRTPPVGWPNTSTDDNIY